MADWTNATLAHGPKLARWCYEHNLHEGEGRSTFMRRLNMWTHGTNPTVEEVDRYLTAKRYHLSELPDEVWIEDSVFDLLDQGLPVKEIARRLGCVPSTVRYHRDRRVAA